MQPLIAWVKSNKVLTLLLVAFVILFFSKLNPSVPLSSRNSEFAPQALKMSDSSYTGGISPEYAPTPEIDDRLVVKVSYLSVLVKNVSEVMDSITNKAESLGGYMVNRNISRPEEGASGDLTIRVPADKLEEALTYIRSVGVRVVSENLDGTDVTDQYTDIAARLDTLEKTKSKFEQILEQAIAVEDILQVQRELVNVQAQIDSLKGQQQYLEKTSATSKITVYLSTDELSLPYAPAQPWRPAVVFKTAVRSLVLALRGVGSAAIWLVVYSVIWLPILLLTIFVPKFIKKKLPRAKS